jgi:hypothetical protein
MFGFKLWGWATFSFVEPIFNLANKGTLNDNDVWTLSPYFKHKNLFNKFLEYRARHPTHSLIRFLIVSNSLDLILDIVLELWGIIELVFASFMMLIVACVKVLLSVILSSLDLAPSLIRLKDLSLLTP